MYQNKTTKTSYRKPAQSNKEDRAKKAHEWLDLLNSKYKQQVDAAVKNTTAVIFRGSKEVPISGKDIFVPECNLDCAFDSTVSKVFKNDVVSCIKAAVSHAGKEDKICVLNYASYSNPGGGFLKGSTAQEEALCYASGLYPCLVKQGEWYAKHCNENHAMLYSDDYIYSINVPFVINGKVYFVDVISIAAPNYAKSKYAANDIMEDRMELLYKIPVRYGATTLLLGAWGCGVFGNETDVIANKWKDLSVRYNGLYKEIVHPVIDDENYKVFRKIFS